jgi:hypothetical protein
MSEALQAEIVQPEHGFCPVCNASLDGGSIWQHFFEQRGDEAEADRVAEMYGATRTRGQWGRVIAIYCLGLDRTVAHRCPDCRHEWPL